MKGITAIEYERTPQVCETAFAIVSSFLDLFYQYDYEGSISILNSKHLRNRKELGLSPHDRLKTFVPKSTPSRSALSRTLVSHGHLSATFFPKNHTSFVEEFLGQGFYELPGQSIILGSGNADDPMGTDQFAEFMFFGQSIQKKEDATGCLFSHDAEFFYIVDFAESFRE